MSATVCDGIARADAIPEFLQRHRDFDPVGRLTSVESNIGSTHGEQYMNLNTLYRWCSRALKMIFCR